MDERRRQKDEVLDALLKDVERMNRHSDEVLRHSRNALIAGSIALVGLLLMIAGSVMRTCGGAS